MWLVITCDGESGIQIMEHATEAEARAAYEVLRAEAEHEEYGDAYVELYEVPTS
jgi:hypothetical protein